MDSISRRTLINEDKSTSSLQHSAELPLCKMKSDNKKRKREGNNRVFENSKHEKFADTQPEEFQQQQQPASRSNSAYKALPPIHAVLKRCGRTGKIGIKNADEFFVPHHSRKGYIICRICNETQWPPNRQKHIVKCADELMKITQRQEKNRKHRENVDYQHVDVVANETEESNSCASQVSNE